MEYSILKYGSCARGTSDKYSDKDLLIVTDNISQFKSIIKTYDVSWSISFYTYDKLRYLAVNGFLFVKHLIDEGQIEYDFENRLKVILDEFKETKNYKAEIQRTKEYFNFISEIPKNEVSLCWLCDNIYVNLRNNLIYKSALTKDYTFSYMDLIEKEFDNKTINRVDLEVLRQLRVIKSCYRNNFYDITPSTKYVNQLIKVVEKLDIPLRVNFSTQNFVVKVEDLDKVTNSYKKLRFLELQFKNLNIKSDEMEKYISNPQFYANCKSIKKVVTKFMKIYRKQHIGAVSATLPRFE